MSNEILTRVDEIESFLEKEGCIYHPSALWLFGQLRTALKDTELLAQLEKERDDLLEGFNKDGLNAREACCGQYKQDLADQVAAMLPVVDAALEFQWGRIGQQALCNVVQSYRSTQRTEP